MTAGKSEERQNNMANDNARSVAGDREKEEHGDGAGARRRSRRVENADKVGPHDPDLLRRFVTEHGKIIPARFTGVSAKQQRRIARLVRRMRVVGMLP